MIYINNVNIYNENTARDLLSDMGMDNLDIEEFKRLLCEEELSEAESISSILKDDRDYYERSCDHYHSVMNEVLNILDEMLEMQRITKPREKLEGLRRMLDNEL